MKGAELLVAKHATLPFIPLRDDIPDKTVRGIYLDLLQAVLTAILTLGPAGTLDEAERGFGKEGPDGSLSDSDVNGFCLMGLWAGDQTLPPELKIHAYSGDCPKYEESYCQRHNRESDEYCGGHRSPPGRRGLSSRTCFEVAGPWHEREHRARSVCAETRENAVPCITGKCDRDHPGISQALSLRLSDFTQRAVP